MKFELLKDIPDTAAKKGMIFKWDNDEHAYTTNELPWYLTPMFHYFEIKRLSTKKRGLFKLIKELK